MHFNINLRSLSPISHQIDTKRYSTKTGQRENQYVNKLIPHLGSLTSIVTYSTALTLHSLPFFYSFSMVHASWLCDSLAFSGATSTFFVESACWYCCWECSSSSNFRWTIKLVPWGALFNCVLGLDWYLRLRSIFFAGFILRLLPFSLIGYSIAGTTDFPILSA